MVILWVAEDISFSRWCISGFLQVVCQPDLEVLVRHLEVREAGLMCDSNIYNIAISSLKIAKSGFNISIFCCMICDRFGPRPEEKMPDFEALKLAIFAFLDPS